MMSIEGRPLLLSEREAADLLNLSVRTLQAWRLNGRGPSFTRLGSAVRYSSDDLDGFIRAGRRGEAIAPTPRDFK